MAERNLREGMQVSGPRTPNAPVFTIPVGDTKLQKLVQTNKERDEMFGDAEEEAQVASARTFFFYFYWMSDQLAQVCIHLLMVYLHHVL